MWELLAGLFVALAAVALVLEPLALSGRRWFPPADPAGDEGLDDEAESPKVQALLALREIEFDRATGKLADADYLRLKAKYETQALDAIAAEEIAAAAASRPVVDRAEEAIRRVKQRMGRACPTCGPRPEANAVFCSTCGRSLVGAGSAPRCPLCGAPLPDGARFCAECGGAIAA